MHQPFQHRLSQATTSAMNGDHQRKCKAWEHPVGGNIVASSYLPTAQKTNPLRTRLLYTMQGVKVWQQRSDFDPYSLVGISIIFLMVIWSYEKMGAEGWLKTRTKDKISPVVWSPQARTTIRSKFWAIRAIQYTMGLFGQANVALTTRNEC